MLDLDYPQKTKSRCVYLVTAAFITACWAWNAGVQAQLSSSAGAAPSFDIGEAGASASALAVYMLFRFWYEVLQTYLYWLMGEIRSSRGEGGEGGEGDGEAGVVARTTGILRSWESIGSTVAYAVGATKVSDMNQMILGFVLWGATVPFTLCAIYGDWAPVRGEDEAGGGAVGGSAGEDSSASVSGLEIEGHAVTVKGDEKC